MKNKYYTAALYMIILIISIPFVQAQSLTINVLSGNQGVENFVAPPDTLTVEVDATLPGDTAITADQLKLTLSGLTGEQPFSSCTGQGDSARCTVEAPIFNMPNTMDATVRLLTDDNKFQPNAAGAATQVRTLTPDNFGATIESITSSNEVSDDGKFVLNVLARDRAVAGNDALCSGVSGVKITDGPLGKVLGTMAGNNQCSFAGNIEITIAEADGEYNLCAQATDLLGKSDIDGIKCLDVIKDASPPELVEARVYQDGSELKFIRPDALATVDIQIEFNDPSLDAASIRADFEGITDAGGYRSRAPDEVINSVAIWRDVPTRGLTECRILVTAQDGSGNRIDDEPITCTTQADTVGPVFLSLSTGLVSNGMPFLSEKTQLKATIKEDGVGINRNQVKLDLTTLNGEPDVRADFCEKVGGNWECTWNIQTKHNGLAGVSAHSGTTDILGNPMPAPFSMQVVVDTRPPTIDQIVVRTMDGETGQQRETDLALKDDIIEVTVVVTDASEIYGNFSAIGVDERINADCIGSATKECTFAVAVATTAPTTDSIQIIAEDPAGNTDIKEEYIKIYSEIDVENPDNFRVDRIVCSPDKIDNAVTSLVEYRATCIVLLKSRAATASVLSVEFTDDQCGYSANDIVSEITLTNGGPKTTLPILNILLRTGSYTGTLDLDCPLFISAKLGDNVVTHAEREDVNMSLTFYGNPLGEASSQMDRKIEKAIDRANNALGWVGELKTVLDYLEKVCQIKSVITNVIFLIQQVGLILKAIGFILSKTPLSGAGEAISQAGMGLTRVEKAIDNVLITTLFEIIDTMCIFINCGAAYNSDDSASKSVISAAGGGGIGGYCTDLQKYLNDLIPDFGSVTGQGGAQSGSTNYQPSGGVTGKSERSPSTGQAYTSDSPRMTEGAFGGIDQQSSQALNIKGSLILSIACFCLPGIIFNLEKYHQLQCKYAVCLGNEVRNLGLPVAFCDEQMAYDECSFIYNQIFNTIPYTQLLSDFGGALEQSLTNPVALVQTVAGFLCWLICEGDSQIGGAACYACDILKTLSKIADAVMSIKQFAETAGDFFEVGDGYCGQMEDIEDQIKKSRQARIQPTEADTRSDDEFLDLQNQGIGTTVDDNLESDGTLGGSAGASADEVNF